MPASSPGSKWRFASRPRARLFLAGAQRRGLCVATGLLVAGLSIAGAMLAGAAGAHTTRPCPCRYPGGLAAPGAIVCLEVDGKRSLARCEMALNNSSWRFLDSPCPVAAPAMPASRLG